MSPDVSEPRWLAILPDVEMLQDSCNVYAIRHEEGTVFVNAGSGRWIDALPDRFKAPHFLLSTHYFRDHSAGAAKAAASGMQVFAPRGEAEIFADPIGHFRAVPNYIVYDNIWENFSPIAGAPVTPVLDYDTLSLAGLSIDVVPLPGVTPHHTGYALTTPRSGRHVVFSGEAIHSPGRMARVAPLQYDYNDLAGAVNAAHSARSLRRLAPDMLLPSLGAPIDGDIDGALAALEASLAALCRGRPNETQQIGLIGGQPLVRVTDHVWMAADSVCVSWFVVSDSGKVLAIDYGYSGGVDLRPAVGALRWPRRAEVASRRPILHSLDALKHQFGAPGIDVVLLSHYHDDHLAGVPILQRLQDTQCWAFENFAPLIEHPEAHRFPCDWPEPIHVDRRIGRGEIVEWEGIRFHFEPMSGHTRFSALIGFEIDGKRFAHAGDQYLCQDDALVTGDWRPSSLQHNEVYRNGADLQSYRDSARWMRQWRPDILLSGHQEAIPTNGAFFDVLDAWGEEFDAVHRAVAALGDGEAHFGVDSMPGWIWPYRSLAAVGNAVEISVTVRNPMPIAAELSLRLVGPAGWLGSTRTVSAGPRQEVTCRMEIVPNAPCRRHPIAVELDIGPRTFGQIAEALVSVGGDAF